MVEMTRSPLVIPEVNQMPQQTVEQVVEEVKPKKSKWPWAILVLIVILVIVGGVLYYLFKNNFIKIPALSTSTNTQIGVPTPKVTDLAPNVSPSLKTVVLIQDSDSAFEKVIMPTDQVNTYIKNLPEGSRVVSQSPDK